MRVPYYQVNAFTSKTFGGNPAGVCPLDGWLADDVLQSIAAENNLSETAFFAPEGNGFRLRWFTPAVEVDLCGHATLASAHVLFRESGWGSAEIRFVTRSGVLTAKRAVDRIELDFPSRPPVVAPDSSESMVALGLGSQPREVWRSRDYMAVFESEAEVEGLTPDMSLLEELECTGVIATAPGDRVDFVSRFFAPRVGIPEDPVTGSAHCTLIPYWAGRLGKPTLFARQISKRGGELHCRNLGERVAIGGRCVVYSRGEILLEP